MSYIKNTWTTGDIITAEKLNNIEGGIEALDQGGGGSSDIVIVNLTEESETWSSDKSAYEIYTAYGSGKQIFAKASGIYYPLVYAENDVGLFNLRFVLITSWGDNHIYGKTFSIYGEEGGTDTVTQTDRSYPSEDEGESSEVILEETYDDNDGYYYLDVTFEVINDYLASGITPKVIMIRDDGNDVTSYEVVSITSSSYVPDDGGIYSVGGDGYEWNGAAPDAYLKRYPG